jgi:hypothetical protein
MTETDARNALLMRAFETTSPAPASWTDDDSAWATRAAAQQVGEGASADAFLAQRARLAAGRLTDRDRDARRAVQAVSWRPWIGAALALAAFVLGAGTDALGASQRINVLAPPLLALLAWNLFAYGAIALRSAGTALGRRGNARITGPVARALGRIAHLAVSPRRGGASARAGAASGGAGASASAAAIARFARDWAQASAGLNGARLSRLLHMAAIAFAAGALAGLYLRGLAFEYRAGWESTFLGVDTLRAILGFVLGPASALTGIPLPDAARLEAMRFPASAGEQAGPWIHLYAVTVALVVLLPRALLALFDLLRERQLGAALPIASDDPYFAALARALKGEPAAVAVVPYSHELTQRAAATLRTLLVPLMGHGVTLATSPAVTYGDEESAGARLERGGPLALAVALMPSTATPEGETHGLFVDTLASSLPAGTPLLVLIDESAFVARFGGDTGSANRRSQRRQAWTRMLAQHDRKPLFVELDPAGGHVSLPVDEVRAAIEIPGGAR